MSSRVIDTFLTSVSVFFILSCGFITIDATNVRIVDRKSRPVVQEASVAENEKSELIGREENLFKDKRGEMPFRETSVYVVVNDPDQDDVSIPVDEIKQDKKVVKKGKFTPLPFPVDFRYYDVNSNGAITVRELIEITGHAENVNEAFTASDLNGDGRVTEEEYIKVPWGYDKKDVVLKHD